MNVFNFLFGSKSSKDPRIQILDPTAYKAAMKEHSPVQLVDVRTEREFKNGHIPGAVLIDFFDQEHFLKSFESFKKDLPLFLYCRSGNRSQKAARRLIQLGFTQIIDLQGGILAWE